MHVLERSSALGEKFAAASVLRSPLFIGEATAGMAFVELTPVLSPRDKDRGVERVELC